MGVTSPLFNVSLIWEELDLVLSSLFTDQPSIPYPSIQTSFPLLSCLCMLMAKQIMDFSTSQEESESDA
jgi:hypothetical protein